MAETQAGGAGTEQVFAEDGIDRVEGEDLEISEGVQPEEEEEEPPEEEHLKTKYVPAVVMLIGGAPIAISCFFRGYPLLKMLLVVLVALFGFWVAGGIIKIFLDKIVIIKPEDRMPEIPADEETSDGEVIEKS